jgi:hypothetical protein
LPLTNYKEQTLTDGCYGWSYHARMPKVIENLQNTQLKITRSLVGPETEASDTRKRNALS